DTLRYDIHVDGHASQGEVRLFFFHYDCQIRGQRRLSVRHGQAGFFTDEELAQSAGVLWSPSELEERTEPAARFDPPAQLSQRRTFDAPALQNFAEGKVYRCFGEGFEQAQTHTLTPRISGGRMLFLDRVEVFDPEGGRRRTSRRGAG